MSLRKSLSEAIRDAKDEGSYTYDQIQDGVGCSRSSVRYALNGGDKVGLDLMEKMLDFMGYKVSVCIEDKVDFWD